MTAPDSRIVVIGLGPGNPALRTVGAQQMLDAADRIILRTRIHPGLDDLVTDARVTDCDDLYESAANFDVLYPAIAHRVLGAAQAGGVIVFAVPGHPRVGERTVPLIESGAHELGIPIDVQDAVSFLDVTAGAVAMDPLARGLQIVDAEELVQISTGDPFSSGQLSIDPVRPLLVAQLYNQDLASGVKISLSRVYPDDYLVIVVRAAGVPGEQTVQELPLHALDRQDVDYLTSVWIPPMPALEAVRSSESLTRIVARLRAPGGCPWDREQTPGSLRNAVLEEAYEVVDAIDSEDHVGLAEELGDLLLLVAMQAQIAEENGAFRIEDVFEEVNRKLIRRHPHVFGSASATTPEAVIATWEGVKERERAERGSPTANRHPIDGLPRSMPVTRKISEILAPRTSLTAPQDPDAGNESLAAIRALVQRGLDPELALEASLRRSVGKAIDIAGGSPGDGIETERGRESA
jgi:tetrapyrrole methylase family protein / MazG family protein